MGETVRIMSLKGVMGKKTSSKRWKIYKMKSCG